MLASFLPARRRILKALPDCKNARHVEALMVAEHGELNWWSQRAFAKAAQAAAGRAAADPVNAERVALATVDRWAAEGERRRGSWVFPAVFLASALAIGIGFGIALAIRIGNPLAPW